MLENDIRYESFIKRRKCIFEMLQISNSSRTNIDDTRKLCFAIF